MSSIEELLDLRAKTEEEKGNIESQWKIDEGGFDIKASQLMEQRWAIEELERKNHNQRDEYFRNKNEKISNLNKIVKDQEDLFKKQITLASLWYCLPSVQFTRGWGHFNPDEIKEEIVYDTPLVKIFALFGENNKPTNKIEYTLKIFTHAPFRSVINLMIKEKQHGKYYFGPDDDLLITQRSFKTLEEAERYHNRNYQKQIEKYIPQIDAINAEIQTASNSLEEVFDFRFIDGNILDGYYAYSPNYNIISKGKNEIVISQDTSRFFEVPARKEFTVTLSNWDLQITPEPDAIQKRSIYGALIYNYFQLPHLYEFMDKIYEDADKMEKEQQHRDWIKAEWFRLKDIPKENWFVNWGNREELIEEVEKYGREN